MPKIDLDRILDEMRIEYRKERRKAERAAGVVEDIGEDETDEVERPRRKKKKAKTASLYEIPESYGGDLPPLLKPYSQQARYRLGQLLDWDNSIRRPDWMLGIYTGWLSGIPYVGTGRVFISGLMPTAVTKLASQRHPWRLLSMMVRQRGIELVDDKSLWGLFPRAVGAVDAVVATVNDDKNTVRLRGRGVRYQTHVDAYDLAMAWRGTPPPHRLMITSDPTAPVVLYDGRGHRSIVVPIQ